MKSILAGFGMSNWILIFRKISGLKMSKGPKNSKLRGAQMFKMAVFGSSRWPKLISRKIWNFHIAVLFPSRSSVYCDFDVFSKVCSTSFGKLFKNDNPRKYVAYYLLAQDHPKIQGFICFAQWLVFVKDYLFCVCWLPCSICNDTY